MSISIKQQAEMTDCIKSIFSSNTEVAILVAVKSTLQALRFEGFFAELPSFYSEISVETVADILSWYQEMKDQDMEESLEEGHLKELYGVFLAANERIKELL